jgi:hypothetical protein
MMYSPLTLERIVPPWWSLRRKSGIGGLKRCCGGLASCQHAGGAAKVLRLEQAHDGVEERSLGKEKKCHNMRPR